MQPYRIHASPNCKSDGKVENFTLKTGAALIVHLSDALPAMLCGSTRGEELLPSRFGASNLLMSLHSQNLSLQIWRHVQKSVCRCLDHDDIWITELIDQYENVPVNLWVLETGTFNGNGNKLRATSLTAHLLTRVYKHTGPSGVIVELKKRRAKVVGTELLLLRL